MLRLKQLFINRIDYGSNAGRYTGKIEFEGQGGSVGLNMDSATCEKMFALVAEGIVDSAKEVAEQLTAEAMASKVPESLKIA